MTDSRVAGYVGANPDYLQFEGGAVERLEAVWRLAHFPGVPMEDHGALRVVWTGPWPPPERMAVAVGKQTQLVKVFEPADLNVDLDELRSVAHVTFYRRDSASRLPDNAVRTHVLRGALYLPEEENEARE